MHKNFTKVFYSKVEDFNLEKAVLSLPKIRVEKIQKLQDKNAKKLSGAVYLLLVKSLKKLGVKSSRYEFKYDANGKPFLEGCPLQFSLSHSGDFVAVAISDKFVGVDIQEMREIDLDSRRFVFSEEDEKFFQESEDKIDAFYSLWTIKEAVYKFDGTPFKEVTIKDAASITVENNYKLAFISLSGNYKIKKIRI